MTYKPLLRKATLEDANAIANVYLTSRKELVAEQNEAIIGMMSLTNEASMRRIKQLYIAPTTVGHGVGTPAQLRKSP